MGTTGRQTLPQPLSRQWLQTGAWRRARRGGRSWTKELTAYEAGPGQGRRGAARRTIVDQEEGGVRLGTRSELSINTMSVRCGEGREVIR